MDNPRKHQPRGNDTMNTGRATKQEQTTAKISYPIPSLEAEYGFTIRKAPTGGGFLFYWISMDGNGNEQLNPLETVSETKAWLTETAKAYGIDLDLLKFSKAMAKATKKNKANETTKVTKTTTFEIIENKINRINPDSGVVNERAYLGVWLPAKVQEEDGVKIRQIFHLLFSDGELVPADSDTLSSKDIFLHSEPVYTELKIGIDTILHLSELPTVNPEQIVFDVIAILKKFVEFDDTRYYALIAYWVIGTYFHKRFSSFPYLFINALKRSGKTKLLDVLKLLTYNAVFSPNMSTSSLFRLTQSAGATTLLDESEDLADPEKQAEFKSLLLSGYKRGTFVYRSEKENEKYIPVPFDVYSPKAIANIRGIDDVLEDRCITITMKRGKNLAIINKDIPTENPIWEEMRDTLTRLYFQEYAAIEATYSQTENVDRLFEDIGVVSADNVVSVVSKRVQEKKYLYVARTWEMWRALFSVGKYIHIFSSKQISTTQTTQTTQTTLNPFADLLSLSVDLITEKEAENATDSGTSMLLMGLLKLVKIDDFYKPTDLIASAKEFVEDNILPSWFNPKWLGREFKRLGFKNKRRQGRGVEYRLTPAQIQDMADRLNIHLPQEMLTEQWFADFDEYYKKWLVTVKKIEECHKRNKQIPWVDPNTEYFVEGLDVEQPKQEPQPQPQKEESAYQPLSCYWCKKQLMDNDWGTPDDGFTEGKPAHTKCTEEKRALLAKKPAQQEPDTRNYGDEFSDPRGGSD